MYLSNNMKLETQIFKSTIQEKNNAKLLYPYSFASIVVITVTTKCIYNIASLFVTVCDLFCRVTKQACRVQPHFCVNRRVEE